MNEQLTPELQAIGREFPDLFNDNGLSVFAGQRAAELREQYAQAGAQRRPYDIMRQACNEVRDRYEVKERPATLPLSARALADGPERDGTETFLARRRHETCQMMIEQRRHPR